MWKILQLLWKEDDQKGEVESKILEAFFFSHSLDELDVFPDIASNKDTPSCTYGAPVMGERCHVNPTEPSQISTCV